MSVLVSALSVDFVLGQIDLLVFIKECLMWFVARNKGSATPTPSVNLERLWNYGGAAPCVSRLCDFSK